MCSKRSYRLPENRQKLVFRNLRLKVLPYLGSALLDIVAARKRHLPDLDELCIFSDRDAGEWRRSIRGIVDGLHNGFEKVSIHTITELNARLREQCWADINRFREIALGQEAEEETLYLCRGRLAGEVKRVGLPLLGRLTCKGSTSKA